MGEREIFANIQIRLNIQEKAGATIMNYEIEILEAIVKVIYNAVFKFLSSGWKVDRSYEIITAARKDSVITAARYLRES